jgi:Cdc6-like AAA superfamily ATPase
MSSRAEKRASAKGTCRLDIELSPAATASGRTPKPADAASCPLRHRLCVDYLRQVRELSDDLADRIEQRYCNGAYPACSRHVAASSGSMRRSFDLAPWADLSTLGAGRAGALKQADRA